MRGSTKRWSWRFIHSCLSSTESLQNSDGGDHLDVIWFVTVDVASLVARLPAYRRWLTPSRPLLPSLRTTYRPPPFLMWHGARGDRLIASDRGKLGILGFLVRGIWSNWFIHVLPSQLLTLFLLHPPVIHCSSASLLACWLIAPSRVWHSFQLRCIIHFRITFL